MWATCPTPRARWGARAGACGPGSSAGIDSPFITRLQEPEPRLAESRALAKSRAVTAMMDNSDGLALSLSDLAEVSQVGFCGTR